jgi:hypothetical protein
MAEQRSYTGSFTNRWKFTGKELDEETGLYSSSAKCPHFAVNKRRDNQ